MAKNTFDTLFGSDKKKAAEGVPISMGYNQNDEEVTVWVAEVNNPKHLAAQRKNAKMLEATRRNQKRHDAVLAKVVAEGILIKWEGMLDSNKKPIESSLQNKTKMLVKYPKFFQAVMGESMNEDNFALPEDMGEKEAAKDTEKN